MYVTERSENTSGRVDSGRLDSGADLTSVRVDPLPLYPIKYHTRPRTPQILFAMPGVDSVSLNP